MKNNCRSNNLDKNDFDIPINSKLGLISNCFLTLYSHHREWYSGRCSSIRLMNSSNHFYFHLCQYELICTLYAADSRFTVAFHNVLFYVIRCFPVDKKTILHWSRNFLSSLRYTLFDGIEIEMIFVSFRDLRHIMKILADIFGFSNHQQELFVISDVDSKRLSFSEKLKSTYFSS